MKISFATYGKPCTFAGRHTSWVVTIDGVRSPAPNCIISEETRYGQTWFYARTSCYSMDQAKHEVIAWILGGSKMNELYAKFGHYANNPTAVSNIINHVSK